MRYPFRGSACVLAFGLLLGCGMSMDEMKGAIHKACADGDMGTVRAILKKAPSLIEHPNAKRGGRTPLHFAGAAEIAEFLIEQGADATATDRLGWTPLHTAASEGVARILLDNGADVRAKAQRDLTPLHTAANEEVARLLISRGANVRGEPDPSRNYGKYGDRDTPLYWAILDHRADVARVLLESGADADQMLVGDKNLLHFAASMGAADCIGALVQHGLRVYRTDRLGATPLHEAVVKDQVKAAEKLLELGADANARLSRHVAIQTNNPNRVGPHAGTWGTGLDLKAAGGKTPLAIAQSDAMKELLRKYGGSE
ncbi:MAG: ankyrin repeat domain-containing protein [Elusimicrobiota bacterium]